MPQPEPRRFLEAPLIDRISSRCRDLGPADQEMGLKVPNLLSIQGELPGSSQPRCRFYETPEHEVGPYGRLVNRALIMRIPAADLGRIAFERWRAHGSRTAATGRHRDPARHGVWTAKLLGHPRPPAR